MVCTLAFMTALSGTALASFSLPPGSEVTITPGGEDCNGIIPTPGSQNTVKTLTGGTLVPGGTATFQISYPVDPDHLGDDWQIVDCVLMGSGTDLKDYEVIDQATFDGVINSTSFLLQFTVSIPTDAAVGTRICNVAKTTEGPSAPQASNRKAGPACFIVGGNTRVEKHSTTDPTGTPIPGAVFTITNCTNPAPTPALQPIIVSPGGLIGPGTGVSTLTVTATTGVIAFAGPVGSSCVVTEITPPAGYGMPADVDQIVTITSAFTATVFSFLDPPAPGSLTITKVAPAGSTQQFTFTINCTNPTNTYSLTITGSGSATQSGIPAGSQCTVTETVPTGFNPPLYSPSNVVTIVSAQTVTVTVTNTLAPGSLTINKVAPAGSSQRFTFTVACTNPTNTYTLAITGSGSATQSGIPAGSICTVVETVPSGFATPVISPPGPYTIGPAQTITVTVTNSLLPGTLTINKVAPAGSDDAFVFDVACTNPTNTYQLTVVGSGSVTQSGIPAGSVCTITEVVPAGFAQPVFTPSNVVTIVADQAVSISVLNSLLPGSLTISKSSPAGSPASFTFVVTCVDPTGTALSVQKVEVPANGSTTIDGLAAGLVCTLEEELPAGFAPVTFSPSDTVTIVPGQTVTVSAANSLLPLGIQIVKTVLPISGAPGSPVTYTYVVTNTGQVDLVDITVDDDKLGHIGDIAFLAVGQSATLTKATTLPAVAGELVNVAIAVGKDKFGRTTSDDDDASVTVVLGTKQRRLPATGTGDLALLAVGLLLMGGFLQIVGRLRPVPVIGPSLTVLAIIASAMRSGFPVPGRHREPPLGRDGP